MILSTEEEDLAEPARAPAASAGRRARRDRVQDADVERVRVERAAAEGAAARLRRRRRADAEEVHVALAGAVDPVGADQVGELDALDGGQRRDAEIAQIERGRASTFGH